MDSTFDNEILHASNQRLVEMLKEARTERDQLRELVEESAQIMRVLPIPSEHAWLAKYKEYKNGKTTKA